MTEGWDEAPGSPPRHSSESWNPVRPRRAQPRCARRPLTPRPLPPRGEGAGRQCYHRRGRRLRPPLRGDGDRRRSGAREAGRRRGEAAVGAGRCADILLRCRRRGGDEAEDPPSCRDREAAGRDQGPQGRFFRDARTSRRPASTDCRDALLWSASGDHPRLSQRRSRREACRSPPAYIPPGERGRRADTDPELDSSFRWNDEGPGQTAHRRDRDARRTRWTRHRVAPASSATSRTPDASRRRREAWCCSCAARACTCSRGRVRSRVRPRHSYAANADASTIAIKADVALAQAARSSRSSGARSPRRLASSSDSTLSPLPQGEQGLRGRSSRSTTAARAQPPSPSRRARRGESAGGSRR